LYVSLYVLDTKQVTGSGLLNNHPVTINLQVTAQQSQECSV